MSFGKRYVAGLVLMGNQLIFARTLTSKLLIVTNLAPKLNKVYLLWYTPPSKQYLDDVCLKSFV